MKGFYIILINDDPLQLALEVNLALSTGYRLAGGLAVAPSGILYQSMLLPFDPKDVVKPQGDQLMLFPGPEEAELE